MVFLHVNITYVTFIPWLPIRFFFLKDQDSRLLPLLLGRFCGLTLIRALQVQPWGWSLARMSASVSVMALSCVQSAVRNRPWILTVWGCLEESPFWGASWNVSHHFKMAHTCEKNGAPQERGGIENWGSSLPFSWHLHEEYLFLRSSIISETVACLRTALWLLPSLIVLKSVITGGPLHFAQDCPVLTARNLHPGANLSPEQISAGDHWL